MTDTFVVSRDRQTDGTWAHTGKLIVSRRLDNGTLASVTLPDTTGPQGPPGPEGPPGQAAGKIFYYATSDSSDIATYKTMLASPSAGAEQTVATPCTGTGDVLVSVFATDPGVPGAVDYPAGTAYRRIYARVSGGTARFHLRVYKRDAGGTETLVRDEFSDNFVDTVVVAQEWASTASAAGALLSTDRIVNKIYAQRVSGPTTITVTSYFEGTTHTSQIQTTITAGAAGPAGPGVATGGATGQVLTKTSAVDFATNWQTPVVSQMMWDALVARVTALEAKVIPNSIEDLTYGG